MPTRSRNATQLVFADWKRGATRDGAALRHHAHRCFFSTRNTTNSRIDGEIYKLSQSETGWKYNTEQVVADWRRSGPVTWFGRQHDVMSAQLPPRRFGRGPELGRRATRVIDIRQWNPYATRCAARRSSLQLGPQDGREGCVCGRQLHAWPIRCAWAGRALRWYAQDVTGWYSTNPPAPRPDGKREIHAVRRPRLRCGPASLRVCERHAEFSSRKCRWTCAATPCRP